MNLVKVSVIIPTYKRPDTIEAAVRSVMKQTLRDIEIIVVDDNNPNSFFRQETEKIVLSLVSADDRVRYIRHEKNMNGSAARNSGIQVAKGEYLAFLDDDDKFLPEKLEVQYNMAKNADGIYAGVVCNALLTRNGRIIKEIEVDEQENALAEVLATSYSCGSGSNLFIRRAIIDDIGIFDVNLQRHQDYDFLVRFFCKYKMLKVSKALFMIEQRATHSNVPNEDKFITAKKYYLEKYKMIIEGLSEEERKNIYSTHCISLAEVALKGRHYSNARYYIKKYETYKKLSVKTTARLFVIAIYSIIPLKIKKIFLFGR